MQGLRRNPKHHINSTHPANVIRALGFTGKVGYLVFREYRVCRFYRACRVFVLWGGVRILGLRVPVAAHLTG